MHLEYICKTCLENYAFDERHDAYYCNNCNEWKEPSCANPDCYYCNTRPPKPIRKK